MLNSELSHAAHAQGMHPGDWLRRQVNLIMDSLASLALATEPPDDSLLQRMPVKRNAFIVSGKMWFNMLGHSLYQLIVVMLMLYEPYMVNCTMDPDTMTAFPDCDTTRSGFLPVSGRYGSCMIHGTDWYQLPSNPAPMF